MDLTEFARFYAQSVKRLVRCPWNPFPAWSPWGQQIDQAYGDDLARAEMDRSIHAGRKPGIMQQAHLKALR
ncbi:hypothetical protein [Methylorubrum sp. SB2]|uniref:hypothetical protein n=1 Tax=Methylorubrum subtropicum TaxID=3138812 RepID=UPI00313BFD55